MSNFGGESTKSRSVERELELRLRKLDGVKDETLPQGTEGPASENAKFDKRITDPRPFGMEVERRIKKTLR